MDTVITAERARFYLAESGWGGNKGRKGFELKQKEWPSEGDCFKGAVRWIAQDSKCLKFYVAENHVPFLYNGQKDIIWSTKQINGCKRIQRGKGRHSPCGAIPRWLTAVHCLSRSSENPGTRDTAWRLNVLQPTFPFSACRAHALSPFLSHSLHTSSKTQAPQARDGELASLSK